MEGEHIVFQFNGERDLSQPLVNQYQEIDILAYMIGIWEKELIQVASVQ